MHMSPSSMQADRGITAFPEHMMQAGKAQDIHPIPEDTKGNSFSSGKLQAKGMSTPEATDVDAGAEVADCSVQGLPKGITNKAMK